MSSGCKSWKEVQALMQKRSFFLGILLKGYCMVIIHHASVIKPPTTSSSNMCTQWNQTQSTYLVLRFISGGEKGGKQPIRGDAAALQLSCQRHEIFFLLVAFIPVNRRWWRHLHSAHRRVAPAPSHILSSEKKKCNNLPSVHIHLLFCLN